MNKSLIFSIVVVIFLSSMNCFAFDIDIEKGTFYGMPFQNNINNIIAKIGKPTDTGYTKKYDNKGIHINGMDNDTNGYYNIYLIKSKNTKIQLSPPNIKPFSGTISFGIHQGSHFNDVVKNIANSNLDYAAFKGKWCLSYSGGDCNIPGYMIDVRVKNDYTCEMVFNDKGIITYIHLSDMADRTFEGRVDLIASGNSGDMQIVAGRNRKVK